MTQRIINSFPHARGGVPGYLDDAGDSSKFSPRTWGCTVPHPDPQRLGQVFPTHVGVYLPMLYTNYPTYGFPHARGGVP